MENIAVVHVPKTLESVELPENWIAWETCLRRMWFGHRFDVNKELSENAEVYVGEEALRFCLEIVCGLHSPIVGETEVWGQFKAKFRALDFGESATGQLVRGFVQKVFKDAKSVRCQHLTGQGSQTYGSLARRLLRGQKVINFLGSGQLVQKMLPWLCEEAEQVNIFCRDVHKGHACVETMKVAEWHQKVNVHALKEDSVFEDVRGALIVAAPVKYSQMQPAFEKAGIQTVLDLRDISDTDTWICGEQLVTLPEFFEEMNGAQNVVQQKLFRAKKEIARKVQEHARSIQVRPYGWEDLCL